MYRLEVEHSAAVQLRKAPQSDYDRLIERIQQLAIIPRPVGCRKLEGGEHDYRIRVGEWRIVYEVDDRAKVVRILRVALRKDVYR